MSEAKREQVLFSVVIFPYISIVLTVACMRRSRPVAGFSYKTIQVISLPASCESNLLLGGKIPSCAAIFPCKRGPFPIRQEPFNWQLGPFCFHICFTSF